MVESEVKCVCSCGESCNFEEILWCESCSIPVCSSCCHDELISLACPQCGRTYTPEKSREHLGRCFRCFDCSECGANATITEQGDGSICAKCSFCGNRSDSVRLSSSSRETSKTNSSSSTAKVSSSSSSSSSSPSSSSSTQQQQQQQAVLEHKVLRFCQTVIEHEQQLILHPTPLMVTLSGELLKKQKQTPETAASFDLLLTSAAPPQRSILELERSLSQKGSEVKSSLIAPVLNPLPELSSQQKQAKTATKVMRFPVRKLLITRKNQHCPKCERVLSEAMKINKQSGYAFYHHPRFTLIKPSSGGRLSPPNGIVPLVFRSPPKSLIPFPLEVSIVCVSSNCCIEKDKSRGCSFQLISVDSLFTIPISVQIPSQTSSSSLIAFSIRVACPVGLLTYSILLGEEFVR